jgi:hypothetical protein
MLGGTGRERRSVDRSDIIVSVLKDLFELIGLGLIAIVGVLLAMGLVAVLFYGFLSF